MNELGFLNKEIKMTSLELTDLINYYRKQEGNKTELLHKDLLKSIRKELKDLEKAGIEEPEGNISPGSYEDRQGQRRPCYELDKYWILEIGSKESAVIRYKIQLYVRALEEQIRNMKDINYNQMQMLAFLIKTKESELGTPKGLIKKQVVKNFSKQLTLTTIKEKDYESVINYINTFKYEEGNKQVTFNL